MSSRPDVMPRKPFAPMASASSTTAGTDPAGAHSTISSGAEPSSVRDVTEGTPSMTAPFALIRCTSRRSRPRSAPRANQ
jgi:hypothetical protein